MDSPLTKDVVEAYKVVCGKDPRVYAIHAGLECSLFMTKFEHLEIETVPRFYKVVVYALEKLAA